MNVFDFDNTIYSGDSTADFYIFSLKRHPRILLQIPRLLYYTIRLYVFKIGTKTEFKEKMYLFLKHVDINRDLPDFWDSHIKNIKEFYLKIQKNDDIIISASPEFLLKPICERLHIHNLIASRVDCKSGKYSRVNCHGKEKVTRFREEFGNTEIGEFYSDSLSDTPLAILAKKSFIVKGNQISEWKFD
ncbi:MAG: HAD-IB family phosphatase [Bacillota bacterium]|nr:HAD-IB family phosphatase [Bacillota bacterium]